jgi:hypothetical protein
MVAYPFHPSFMGSRPVQGEGKLTRPHSQWVKKKKKLGKVAHTCHPSYRRCKIRRITIQAETLSQK